VGRVKKLIARAEQAAFKKMVGATRFKPASDHIVRLEKLA
jgi:hypothetical protein